VTRPTSAWLGVTREIALTLLGDAIPRIKERFVLAGEDTKLRRGSVPRVSGRELPGGANWPFPSVRYAGRAQGRPRVVRGMNVRDTVRWSESTPTALIVGGEIPKTREILKKCGNL